MKTRAPHTRERNRRQTKPVRSDSSKSHEEDLLDQLLSGSLDFLTTPPYCMPDVMTRTLSEEGPLADRTVVEEHVILTWEGAAKWNKDKQTEANLDTAIASAALGELLHYTKIGQTKIGRLIGYIGSFIISQAAKAPFQVRRGDVVLIRTRHILMPNATTWVVSMTITDDAGDVIHENTETKAIAY